MVFCFTVLAYTNVGQIGPKIVDTDEAAGILSLMVLAPSQQCTKDSLVTVANEYLDRYSKVSLLDVKIYSDRPTLEQFAAKKTFHLSYDQWRREFESRIQKDSSSCVAEVLKLGGDSTLRVRSKPGSVFEVSIKGSNAFQPTIDGVTLNLLHVEFSRQGLGGAKYLTPILYFEVSQDVSPQQAATIAESIRQSSGCRGMKILMRRDEWYVFDPYYPWRNAFGDADIPPTENEAARSWEFLCEAGAQACHQSSTGSN